MKIIPKFQPGRAINYKVEYGDTVSDNSKDSNKKLSTYTIKAGDSLSEIARDNNISLSELTSLNNISDPNKIRVGQVIQIPKNTLQKKKLEVISLEESDWNEKLINSKNDIDIINTYHQDKQTYYLIDDKINDKLYLCKNGKIIKSYPTLHSKYAKDDDEMTISDGMYGGNLKFPAGVYFITRLEYNGAPAYMRRTRELVKENNKNGIPNSIHAGDINDPRGSNGCTRMNRNDIIELSKYIGQGNDIPCYILPANPDNKFFIRNGELQFHSSNIQKVPSYNTLTYKPIESITYDESLLPKGAKTKIIDEFAEGLKNYKQLIMEDMKINTDTYNKLAKACLGILGVETTFGKRDSFFLNLERGFYKGFINHNTSSGDYLVKYEGYTKHYPILSPLNEVIDAIEEIPYIGEKLKESTIDSFTHGASKPENSVGLTQIRLIPGNIYQDVLDLINAYGITADDLVYNPQKAAAATMLILAYNYKNMGQDVDKAVKAYNNKPSYVDLVKNYSKLFNINLKV